MSAKNQGGRRKRDDVAVPLLSSRSVAAQHRVEVINTNAQSTRTLVASSSKRKRQTPHDLDDTYRDFDPEAGGEMIDFQSGGVNAGDGLENSHAMPKRYMSSDAPMATWRPHANDFLDELLRRDALVSATSNDTCSTCHELPSHVTNVNETIREVPDLIRCDVGCHGGFLECRRCSLQRHHNLPLHQIKRWNGQFWTPYSTQALGVTVQIGHHGLSCAAPMSNHGAREFDEDGQMLPPTSTHLVVVDTTGIYNVTVMFCGCALGYSEPKHKQLLRDGWYPSTVAEPKTVFTFACLDQFQSLSNKAHTTPNDFVGSLNLLTDATRILDISNISVMMIRVARQWGFLHRAKRSGQGHSMGGLEATRQGGNAVQCWACPRNNVNLPVGWETVAPEYRHLYMLILSMDANFRLRSRLRGNARVDDSLGSGWCYFVPERPYKTWLLEYVTEKDASPFEPHISTCAAFNAMAERETKINTGLQASGIGGVICARHEIVRPNGLGDLQKGERWSNMDWIFANSVRDSRPRQLTVSYDIACQWYLHLQKRMEKMPSELQLNREEVRMQFALPGWHASAHIPKCAKSFSIKVKPGTGKTDGEGIERLWSLLNGASNSTKEMGKGGRWDFLDERVGFLNFEKNIKMDTHFGAKLLVAWEELEHQRQAFQELTSTLDNDTRKAWTKLVHAWEADDALPNPYMLDPTNRPTEADIRAKMNAEEVDDLLRGNQVAHETSQTAFLIAGLRLEDLQLRIRRDIQPEAGLTACQASEKTKRRRQFLVELQIFRLMQAIYMPGAIRTLKALERDRAHDAEPLAAEDMNIYLPSEMPVALRSSGCADGLVDREITLRVGQCHAILDTVRSYIHSKHHLLYRIAKNTSGQKEGTKSSVLIARVSSNITLHAAKYNKARVALLALTVSNPTSGAYDQFRILTAEDFSLITEEREAEAIRRLKHAGGKRVKAKRDPKAPRPVMSWLWTAGGGPDADDEDAPLHCSVRVEWLSARREFLSWNEEVGLIKEEMRRALRTLDHDIVEWTTRAQSCALQSSTRDAKVLAGASAYAMKQADGLRAIKRRFQTNWQSPKIIHMRSTTVPQVISQYPDELDNYLPVDMDSVE